MICSTANQSERLSISDVIGFTRAAEIVAKLFSRPHLSVSRSLLAASPALSMDSCQTKGNVR